MERPNKTTENITFKDVESQLLNAGIDTSTWGTGSAKTIEHLYNEMKDGESKLVTDAENGLLKITSVVGATIYYESPSGDKYRLKEDKQIFSDGRERIRPSDSQSVFEKMQFDEDPTEAMKRGLQEELGIKDDTRIVETETNKKIQESASYPGLLSETTFHFFDVYINDDQFEPDGYTEEQARLTTYFIWEKL